MDYIVLIIAVAVALLGTAIFTTRTSSKNLRQRLEDSFGKEPRNPTDALDSIETYHEDCLLEADSTRWIDATTWDDLEMDAVFQRMNSCCTSVGEEYLYHLLHVPCADPHALEQRERLLTYLKEHPDWRLKLQLTFSKLGKREYHGLTEWMKPQTKHPLNYPYLYPVLAALPLLGVVLIPFLPMVGIGVLLASFAVNLAVHYSLAKNIDVQLTTLEYFSSLLWCCHHILETQEAAFQPFTAQLESGFQVFRSLRSKIPLATKRNFSDMDVLGEYAKILFLSDLRRYNKVMKQIDQHKASFRQLYEGVGELDASISILSYRASLPHFCVPAFHEESKLDCTGLYHPLLVHPVVNKAAIHTNWLITGSNASGKSTFIKAVAINGILAQTIYTCTAERYATRNWLVMTSMAVRDHLIEGDSYFVTEIRSLKRILDTALQMPCLCVIDEILKGTNTAERIAASTAILEYLQQMDCRCIVASHDIELTKRLAHQYENYHFSEQISNEGICFDYLLKSGASQTRNAIKLLDVMGFDPPLVKRAEALVAEVDCTGEQKRRLAPLQ